MLPLKVQEPRIHSTHVGKHPHLEVSLVKRADQDHAPLILLAEALKLHLFLNPYEYRLP